MRRPDITPYVLAVLAVATEPLSAQSVAQATGYPLEQCRMALVRAVARTHQAHRVGRNRYVRALPTAPVPRIAVPVGAHRLHSIGATVECERCWRRRDLRAEFVGMECA